MAVSETEPRAATPGRDFNRLWLATATSQAGSSIAYGALPLVDRRRPHVPRAGGLVDHHEGRPARRGARGRGACGGDEPTDRDRGGRRRTPALLGAAPVAFSYEKETYL
ncbi:hypothetical protein GCM10010197_09010 [Nocardioides luteus]|uniref:Major facilitator superfamily (MFS) profile domain-containing protein n=1 Tax=Nocardioides luteus TaxID=1844 RepID=A0ABQ5SXL8_9ACTN|nr:hypothetical protein GCM10010197_09010 [Nocardioides luteus]GLJ68765.1 hypothetical protein GCM10017579_28010 [Nocardioides luteus]